MVCIFCVCIYVIKIIFFFNLYRFKFFLKYELIRDIINFYESEYFIYIFYLKNKGL